VNPETGTLSEFLQESVAPFREWWATIEANEFVWATLFVVLVIMGRKIFARWVMRALRALLKRFSLSLSDEVSSQIELAAQVLLVVFALFVSMSALNLSAILDGTLARLLKSVAIVAVFGTWYQLSGPFAAMLRSDKRLPAKSERDWIQRVSQFAILLFGLTSLLKVWNVDISGALTGVGVLGAGLAIAVQDLIRNLIAGMTNISEKRFETGDAIQIDGKFAGTVRRIDIRSTLVVGFDQIPRHIPNSDLSDSIVLNYSNMNYRRILMKIPLVFSSTREQIEAVRDALREYHHSCEDFDLSDAAAKYIYVSELNDSSVDILVYVWTKGPAYDEYLQVIERLTLAILDIVRANGAQLAYPTQVVHLDNDPNALRIAEGLGPPNS
jgi:MscS family membrane protein